MASLRWATIASDTDLQNHPNDAFPERLGNSFATIHVRSQLFQIFMYVKTAPVKMQEY